MKNIKHFLFLIVLIVVCSQQVHAEYLLYKLDSEGNMQTINKIEHAQTYPILTKYQFPMSLCYQFTGEELKELDANEEAFIQAKMPKDIKVAFIPKTLYELLFYRFISETENDKRKEIWKCFSAIEASFWKNHFNNDQNVVSLHYIFNEKITTYLRKDLEKSTIQKIDFKKEIEVSILSINKILASRLVNVCRHMQRSINIFSKAIELEFEAHKKGCWTIYRGTSGVRGLMDSTIAAMEKVHTACLIGMVFLLVL